jgi:acyl carrier protein
MLYGQLKIKKPALNITDEVIQIIHEQLGVPRSKIKLTSNIKKDLGADELDCVELIMACEETFNVEIEDQPINTVQQLINISNTAIKKNRPLNVTQRLFK